MVWALVLYRYWSAIMLVEVFVLVGELVVVEVPPVKPLPAALPPAVSLGQKGRVSFIMAAPWALVEWVDEACFRVCCVSSRRSFHIYDFITLLICIITTTIKVAIAVARKAVRTGLCSWFSMGMGGCQSIRVML